MAFYLQLLTGWLDSSLPTCSPVPGGRGSKGYWPCFLEPWSQKEQPKEKQGVDHTEQWRRNIRSSSVPANYLLQIHTWELHPSTAARGRPFSTHSWCCLRLVFLLPCCSLHLAWGGFISPLLYPVGLIHCCFLHPLIWRTQSVKVGTKSFLILCSLPLSS